MAERHRPTPEEATEPDLDFSVFLEEMTAHFSTFESRAAEVVASPEGAPRLKAVEVTAGEIGGAMDKVQSGAGQAELDWVLDPANFAEASEMLPGDYYYFFPHATDVGDNRRVPYVRTRGASFGGNSLPRSDEWGENDRIVVFDKERSPAQSSSKKSFLSAERVRRIKDFFLKRKAKNASKVEFKGIPLSRRRLLQFVALGAASAVSRDTPVFSENGHFGVPLEEKPPTDPHERVLFEVARAERLLKASDPLEMLKSPYLVSALYYSDEFIAKIKAEGAENSGQTIITTLASQITPLVRMRFITALEKKAKASGHSLYQPMVTPLDVAHLDYGKGENHPNALDIFASEGTKVRSVYPGIVILAEDGWNSKDSFSTSSFKGGNAVIVFSPYQNSFLRYCHLDTVSAHVGKFIDAGTIIGTVGNTGENASLPGHGKHLHLEENLVFSVRGEMHPRGGKGLRMDFDAIEGK
ncbi:MAG: M23 family metallopeptidase [Patescibacteria group bacterium]